LHYPAENNKHNGVENDTSAMPPNLTVASYDPKKRKRYRKAILRCSEGGVLISLP